jgi:predicted nuclease of restriction endonuclease-like RecB superfamily
VLTKDLLRVSRRGGGYQPEFAGADDEALAGRLLGVFQGHVGESRGSLRAAIDDLEGEARDFKLVRGLAHLLEREARFETRAPVDPRRAREAAFAAAEAVGVVTPDERAAALRRAGDALDADADAVEASLFADRDTEQVLVAFDPRWDPAGLVAQYNLSLAQTALFDATEMRVRTDDPRGLVSAIKRLGLLYEFYRTDGGQEVRLVGPDALFRRSRRYGTRFARALRAVVRADEWRIAATVDDRGTERELVLTEEDPVGVPDADPVTDVTFDSGVEREFAARFSALALDWELVREPAVLEAGDRLMVPDFAFEWPHADFRVYFEIMGFWTPEYVEKKLAQLDAVGDTELLVAVDESLGVGEEIAARDHRVLPYSGSVRVKDVRDALRDYEATLVADAADSLPAELVPDDDVVTLAALAERHGTSEAAVEGKCFPEHRLVGRTLVRPRVLDALAEELEEGIAFADAEAVLDERDIADASAALAALGYRVEWEGLSGGTLRKR